MAVIASTDAQQRGAFVVTETTLGADDTLTFNSNKVQLLSLRNPTAGTLTATIDGDGGTTVAVDGVGDVSVAAGLAVPVAAGVTKVVRLSSVREYCKGVVHVTGGTGIVATLLNL